ncbi:hypothetical protein [Nocardia sp. NRRL S-836]|uniref:hypothetical protein n=1 Tax=Nocardia sp. NRRL S-836 TaxID=1519492 RepID=UPI0006AFFB75|nr:hypothetical protein [Nocardia sp. NRRL S-836]KOV84729.1 hypothetical protein ADL03_15795 [Nocardia sp. NRRL S-836]
MTRTLTTLTDITGGELQVGQMVHLDGRARQVLFVGALDTDGYREVRFDGFHTALRIGGHWAYSLVTETPA